MARPRKETESNKLIRAVYLVAALGSLATVATVDWTTESRLGIALLVFGGFCGVLAAAGERPGAAKWLGRIGVLLLFIALAIRATGRV